MSRLKVLNDLQSDSDLLGGECDDGAHGALRIAFHDAIGFSLSGKVYALSAYSAAKR
jgi:hypothetical protein